MSATEWRAPGNDYEQARRPAVRQEIYFFSTLALISS